VAFSLRSVSRRVCANSGYRTFRTVTSAGPTFSTGLDSWSESSGRRSVSSFLPNFANLPANHDIAFLAAERLGKLRHVRERPIRAKLWQGMRIGVGLKPRELGAD